MDGNIILLPSFHQVLEPCLNLPEYCLSMRMFGGYLLSFMHFATHIRQGLSLFGSASSETALAFYLASILLESFGHQFEPHRAWPRVHLVLGSEVSTMATNTQFALTFLLTGVLINIWDLNFTSWKASEGLMLSIS